MKISALPRNVLAIVLAGGRGTRLKDLTARIAKPAVPFGGKFRIIDFAMANLVNSMFRNIIVLLQYGSFKLIAHLQKVWNSDPAHGFFVYPLFPQHIEHTEYQATADAVKQSLPIVEEVGDFQTIAIFAGDHVSMMDVSQMVAFHCDTHANFTVAAIELPADAVSEFGVFEVNEKMRIVGFQEKPKSGAKEIPGKPGWCLASMGNYVSERGFLENVFREMEEEFEHPLDFGRDVVPFLIKKRADIRVYNFSENRVPGVEVNYWEDVGTVDAYHRAHKGIAGITPPLNLYNEEWPIRTYSDNLPGAKFINASQREGESCIASGGCIIQRCEVSSSVLGRSVRVYDRSVVRDSVLHDRVVIGDGCIIHNAIIESAWRINEDRVIPPGTSIGIDSGHDKSRGFHVSEGGVVIVPPDAKF